jgi:hypothetical protein
MHLMLQLAVFMGCAEVILLGNDFRWNMDGVVEGGRTWTTDGPDANHFSPDYWPKGFQSFPPNPAVMRRAFVAAREGCEAMGVKVYNATPNSGLDVFEQIELVGVTP